MGIQKINKGRAQRIEWIDALKGFAILSVVLGHVLLGYGENYAFETSINNTILSVMDWIYAWHMPLFFAISGYTFHLAYVIENKKQVEIKGEKIKKQIINLFGIYLLFQIALCVLKTVFSTFVDNSMTFSDLVGNIIIPNTLMWYIWVLIIYYVLFSFLIPMKISSNRFFLIITFFLAIAILATDEKFGWGLALKNLVHNLFYFAIGTKELIGYNRKIRVEITSFLCILASIIFLITKSMNYPVLSAALSEIIAITAILSIFYLFEERNVKNSILVRLGKKSLVIYLLHTYFVTAFKVLFIRGELCNTYSVLPIILVTWIVPVVITYGIAIMCDKYKWLGWIFHPVDLLKK